MEKEDDVSYNLNTSIDSAKIAPEFNQIQFSSWVVGRHDAIPRPRHHVRVVAFRRDHSVIFSAKLLLGSWRNKMMLVKLHTSIDSAKWPRNSVRFNSFFTIHSSLGTLETRTSSSQITQ